METDWIDLGNNTTAKFVHVPYIEPMRRQELLYSEFSHYNFMSLAASIKPHKGLTGLIHSTKIRFNDHIFANNQYLFVQDIEKVTRSLRAHKSVDFCSCYPYFNYYSIEVGPGLCDLDLQAIAKDNYTMKKKDKILGLRYQHITTALFSTSEKHWYLTRCKFDSPMYFTKGGVFNENRMEIAEK